MEELLVILEPMFNGELVHEFGSSETEEMERHDIYENHKQAQTALVVAKTVSVDTHVTVVSVGVVTDGECDDTDGEGDPAAAVVAGGILYDVLAHFHSL